MIVDFNEVPAEIDGLLGRLDIEVLKTGWLEIRVSGLGDLKEKNHRNPNRGLFSPSTDVLNAIVGWLNEHGFFLCDNIGDKLTDAPILSNQFDDDLRLPENCWVFSSYMTEDWCEKLASQGSVHFVPIALL